MSDFLTFLRQRLQQGGFTTQDVLAGLLPLFRQTAAAHRGGRVAPLAGLEALHVQGVQVRYEEGRAMAPKTDRRVSDLDRPPEHALDVVGEARWTMDVGQDLQTLEQLTVGKRDEPITRPVYLPGYVSWEHQLGHHDPLTDIFSAGMLLASLACGLDFTAVDDLEAFVHQRRNLFDLNPNLHPVLAKAIVRMTELSRHRRPQDLSAVLHTLENYRDQEVDFDFDLARIKELKTADVRNRRGLILSRLQQRLFELSRRNRLLHFRPTAQTVNLTWASVPLSFAVESIRPEQVLTWNEPLQKAIVAGNPLPLNRYLNFEEAIYLPSVLDEIRNEARRDQAEFGFAQLRLVLCFLRWSNLKEKPPERFDSPLVLLPVHLTKSKGVRDVHHLEPLATEAEVNPILRHSLKQLYNIDLPETIDLADTKLDTLHEFLAAKIQASEPAVTVAKIDRPRIQLIHARARRRLDQYQRRVGLADRGVRSFSNLDYSYDRDNYHPLGLRLFQTFVRAPETSLRTIVDETPRPRSFMHSENDTLPAAPPSEESNASPSPLETPLPDKERMLYVQVEEETNPYQWEFDLCSVTLGNFRYRKMSLVRDYEALLADDRPHAGFETIFSLDPKPAQTPETRPLPLGEAYPIVSCDPTQASAVALARAGHDYIIQGPPGTGKSQTITNLIADFVVRGRRVLFVCEKRAAIDVVFHRLKQTGLDELCCLIHDSQADKKAFVMDLKATYERHLEKKEETSGAAQKQRQALLGAVNKELAPLAAFDEAMRGTRPEAGLPTRRLLERALNLASPPELSARERECIPRYALWREHEARLTRLTTSLREARGDDVFAKHPLCCLHPRYARLEQPLHEAERQRETIERLLDDLQERVAPLALPEAVAGSLEGLRRLLAFAEPLRFLANAEQMALLQPKSDLSREWTDRLHKIEQKEKELQTARNATKAWRVKLPPEEVAVALEQARRYEGSLLRFLMPGWWRLRGIMQRSYDFSQHRVRPTWRQALEALEREHKVNASLADLEAEARGRFSYAGPAKDFAGRLEAARAASKAASDLPADLQQRVVDPARGAQLTLAILEVAPVIEQLTASLDSFLIGAAALPFDGLRDELRRVADSLDDLPDFIPCLTEVAALPDDVAHALRAFPLPPEQLEAAAISRSLADIYRGDRALARFTGEARDRHAQRLEESHDRLYEANAAAVHESIRERFLQNVATSSLPHGQLNSEQKEFKVVYNRGRRELEHEFGKTMRYKSIRELVVGNSGVVVRDLKPVWLMSPLSVSDTLPLEADLFDVVIFDEASQVTLEEAVPALFRAKQVIVVGDEMQLPPTNFFSARQADEELPRETEEGQTIEYDLSGNSFLNHAARKLPATMLGWHYRSRSETLISFSNAAFYRGRLLTVPEVALPPEGAVGIQVKQAEEAAANVQQLLDRPITYHLLQQGLYVERRNAAEAAYIAHLVRELLTRDTKLTIGVVAFSEAQQGEIEKALNALAREDASFADLLEAEYEREEDGQFVGLLVKNLENIQGDERDIVIISVCYGPGPTGKMLMNFGPINQSGGERRLNVAFSRAKRHMVIVSSIVSSAITNDYNDGARCLKNYLHYAEAASRGDLPSMRRVLRDAAWGKETETARATSDAVLGALAAALRAEGYVVELNLGQSQFRCDLAVRRAEDDAYRLGILVDTEAFYEQPDLIARDVLKPKLLRAFGWRVVHVLTKDWHERRDELMKELRKQIKAI